MRATDKPFNIDKKLVYEAYQAVQSNGGPPGVDGQIAWFLSMLCRRRSSKRTGLSPHLAKRKPMLARVYRPQRANTSLSRYWRGRA
jgi:hypothetical protein